MNSVCLVRAAAIPVVDMGGGLVAAADTPGGTIGTGSDIADSASADAIAILDAIDKSLADLENKLRRWGTAEDPTLLQQQIIRQIDDMTARLQKLMDKVPALADRIDAADEKLAAMRASVTHARRLPGVHEHAGK